MKQPFNLSQEKIDQLFRHCIFDLTPKAIGNKYMYYHTSDNAYRYRIQWTEKDDRSYHSYPCSDITEDLFESAIIFAAYTIALCAASLFPALR